ncbi:hypothetical protein KJ975_14135 [Myxococcota bacterium]|nr:hypothetical protein [Myxococcota bacterium]
MKILLTVLLMSVWFAAPVHANDKSWKPLEIPEAKKVEKGNLSKIIEMELPGYGTRVLAYPQILRIEITGGTGATKTSETVFLFKNIPDLAMLKADSDLKGSRDAVAFSSFKACVWNAEAEMHDCKGAGLANAGAVDVLPVVSQKHVLLVSRARSAGKARTVLWLAYSSAASVYYLPYANMGFAKLGLDNITVTSYVPTTASVPVLPPDPMDGPAPVEPEAKSGTPEPEPVVEPHPTNPTSKPPVSATQLPAPETPAQWKGYTVLNTTSLSRTLPEVWTQDRLTKLTNDASLRSYHWVRIQVKGVDLNTAKSLKLALPVAPAMTYVYSWTDAPKEFRSFLGDLGQCQKRGAKGCPIRVDGTRWYDLTGMIQTTRFVAQSSATKPGSGQLILWMGFSVPVRQIGHNQVAQGKITAVAFPAAAGAGVPVQPLSESAPPAADGLPQDGPMRLTLTPKTVTYPAASNYLRSVGIVPQDSGLLTYRYMLRISLKPASNARQALELTLPAQPKLILGRSQSATGTTSDNARIGMVQLGKPGTCRIKGDQMHCPMHFHGLGWRDLSGGFLKGKTRIIFAANSKSEVQEMVFFLAFEQAPAFVQVEEYPSSVNAPVITTSLYQIQQFR